MADLGPLQRLLLAYAPASERDWQGLCWLLDQRLAAVVQRGSEPTIAAIRLAWWDEVLVEQDRAKGGGEPLVERWRAIAPAGAGAAAERLIDGWRLLLSPEPLSEDDLRAYGLARGGGLFGLIAGDVDEALAGAGAVWALWDLAGHVRDEELARQALAAARLLADGAGVMPGGRAAKPLRLAHAVARRDVLAGAVPPTGFSLRHYGRLLLASLRD
jgi:phytoene synthase